jgi:hypothetical protein
MLKFQSGSHGPTRWDILAVAGRTRRLGLKTSEEIGRLLASFVGLYRISDGYNDDDGHG